MMVVMGLRILAGLAATAACLVLVSDGLAARGGETVDRGVVQSVSAEGIVLRQLDGTTIELALGTTTRFRLNGEPSWLASIRPGFVAAVVHDGEAPAVVVRAFGRFARLERGVVAEIVNRTLVLRRDDGSTLSIRLTRQTRVRRGAFPAPRSAVRPGRRVDVQLAANGAARLIVVRRGGL
jgi:hypothetical protein